MYQVCVWDQSIWNDKAVSDTFTTEAEAVLIAVQRSHAFTRTLFGIIEDGYDVPVAMIYDGRIFPRKPIVEENYTIDETDKWISDYVAYNNRGSEYVTVDEGDGLRLCKICKDRYATRGDGVCRVCHDQWLIDQM